MLNGLDLFSGIGGLTIALSSWVHPIAYCERDRYAQSVLLSRMANGDLPHAPIWDDVRTLPYEAIPTPNIVYGGFPCQDISIAGTGKGLDGERSGLFFEIIRICSAVRPQFIFLENVPAITFRGLDRVLLEFSSMGYDCRWTIVSAAEVGAMHIRDRWFLLAHANCESSRNEWEKVVRHRKEMGKRSTVAFNDGWRKLESRVGRSVNGVPNRAHRLKGLGNAVVPIQAQVAFQRLIGLTPHPS